MKSPVLASGGVSVRRIEGAPIVAVRAVLPGGSRREPIPGLALVTGRMLAEGSRRRDWRAISEAVEARGMTISGGGGVEAHGVSVDALARDWEQALCVAAELLFEPAFPDDRLRWIARQAAAELESEADEADLLTARHFLSELYLPHPKGRPLQGDPASLMRLSLADCASFHSEALARGGWLVVAGEIDAEAVAAAASRIFAALQAPRGDAYLPAPSPPPHEKRSEIATRATDQAHLFAGQLTVARSHPEFAALEVAGVILGAGAGLAGRMPQRLRDREGLAYAVSADTVSASGVDPGRLVVYVGTAEQNLARAESGLREELKRLLSDGVSAREVEEARSYLLGREPFRRETARQWADLVVRGAIVERPLEDSAWCAEEIRAVDRAAVEVAFRRHIDVERLVVTVGLPRGESVGSAS